MVLLQHLACVREWFTSQEALRVAEKEVDVIFFLYLSVCDFSYHQHSDPFCLAPCSLPPSQDVIGSWKYHTAKQIRGHFVGYFTSSVSSSIDCIMPDANILYVN